jgi:adenine-specific DNA methylase
MADLNPEIKFPSTRYSGSKRRFLHWIWENVSDIKFDSALDVFGGTASVSLLFKQKGKRVHYNDILSFNQIIGTALIANSKTTVTGNDLENIFKSKPISKKKTIQNLYTGTFYLEQENIWLDNFIQKVAMVDDKFKRAIILSALFQACLSKRPFNLFHRANLNLRTNDVKRNFGNKTTWEKPFEELIKKFVAEYNQSVFDNEKKNKVVGGHDALYCPNGVDLVYIDPPYFSNNHSSGLNYLEYYNFLEGIANYNKWTDLVIDSETNVPKLKEKKAIQHFTNKEQITNSIEKLIERFQDNIIVMSYLDEGIPDKQTIKKIFKKYGKKVTVKEKQHKYALSHYSKNELLFIAK